MHYHKLWSLRALAAIIQRKEANEAANEAANECILRLQHSGVTSV